MSFKNKPIVILVFLALFGCKGLQYYQSGSNPANISILLKAPGTFYSNVASTDSVSVFIINNNSEPVTVSNIPGKISFIGQSRFYKRELVYLPAAGETSTQKTTLSPGDTVLVLRVPVVTLLNHSKSWTADNKPVYAPHLKSAKAYHPYFYLAAQFEMTVPNQEQVIKIRSEAKKTDIKEFTDPGLTSKKTTLTLTCDTKTFNAETPSGNLSCKITNTSNYPVPLFNDPGSVRFKIYAYNPNRTSVMHTEYILSNGKLPVQPVSIASGTSYTITASLSELLFKQPLPKGTFYWAWNKKDPPVSPLIYGKKEIAMDVEFWFGVVVDGKEYLSNTIYLTIDHSVKRKTKRSR